MDPLCHEICKKLHSFRNKGTTEVWIYSVNETFKILSVPMTDVYVFEGDDVIELYHLPNEGVDRFLYAFQLSSVHTIFNICNGRSYQLY